MTLEEMKNVVNQAKRTINQGDDVAREISGMLRYRLRAANLPDYVLKSFKKELENYNAHTRTWKD